MAGLFFAIIKHYHHKVLYNVRTNTNICSPGWRIYVKAYCHGFACDGTSFGEYDVFLPGGALGYLMVNILLEGKYNEQNAF